MANNNFSERSRVKAAVPVAVERNGQIDEDISAEDISANADREVSADLDEDSDENASHIAEDDHERVSEQPATADEIAYRNGYVEGQEWQRIHESVRRHHAASGLFTGTMLGVGLASLVGLVLATIYFSPNRQPAVSPSGSPIPVQPAPPPTSISPGVVPNQTGQTAAPVTIPSPQNTQMIVPSSPQPTLPETLQPLPQADPVPSQSSLGQPSPLPPDAQNLANPFFPEPPPPQTGIAPDGRGLDQ